VRDTQFGDFFLNLFIHQLAHGFIGLPLRIRQFDISDHFRFHRQFAGDLVFRSPQQERFDAPVQQFLLSLIAISFNGMPEFAIERFFIPQKSGQQEMELGPQFSQVIFQRCSGQAQFMVRFQHGSDLCRF